MTGSASAETQGLRVALGIYVAVFVLKLSVWFGSGIMAVFAEALHTLSDLFISSLLLAAAVWSRKSADEVHQFGHGRSQNAAALAAAVPFLSFTSYTLYAEAIPHLWAPVAGSYRNLDLVLAVLVVSIVLAAEPQRKRRRESS